MNQRATKTTNGSATSWDIFQDQLSAMSSALEASPHLDFDSSVNHNGLEVVDLIPEVAILGKLVGDMAVGRCTVVIYVPGCNATVSNDQVGAKLVELAAAAIPNGVIQDHVVIATDDKEYELYYKDSTNHYNVWFVRRVGFTNQRGGGIDDDLVSQTHIYEFRYFRAREE